MLLRRNHRIAQISAYNTRSRFSGEFNKKLFAAHLHYNAGGIPKDLPLKRSSTNTSEPKADSRTLTHSQIRGVRWRESGQELTQLLFRAPVRARPHPLRHSVESAMNTELKIAYLHEKIDRLTEAQYEALVNTQKLLGRECSPRASTRSRWPLRRRYRPPADFPGLISKSAVLGSLNGDKSLARGSTSKWNGARGWVRAGFCHVVDIRRR